jgi:HAMP domain-containing protein
MIDAQERAGASPTPQHNRRRFRSHLVNRDVRLRLVLDDTLFSLIAALTAIGILYYLSNKQLGDSLWSAHLSIKETRELLHTGVWVAGAVTFIAVLLFSLWSLIDAHRIAGPMHRLHRLLNEIADGNLIHKVQFRRRDEFQELAAATDRLVDSYSERLTALRQRVRTIEQALTNDTLTAEQLRDLRRQAGELTEQLGFFQLPADNSRPVPDDRPLS